MLKRRTTARVRAIAASCLVLAVIVTPTASGADVSTPAPGTIVRVDGVGAMVPPPGTSVTGYWDGPAHTYATITIVTMPDGTVSVNPPDAGPGPVISGPITGNECTDSYNDTQGDEWDITMKWWFNSNSLPNELGLSATISDLRAGATNITQEVNDCGMNDEMSAAASYQGTNDIRVDMSASGDCLKRNGVSQVDFGDLPGWFAGTCNWNDLVGLDHERVESDIRLNKVEWDWTTGTDCRGSHSDDWYVEGIMTHERGHTWNVVDFENHPNLTMGGAAGGCPEGPDEKSSLGMGDMLSLESRY